MTTFWESLTPNQKKMHIVLSIATFGNWLIFVMPFFYLCYRSNDRVTKFKSAKIQMQLDATEDLLENLKNSKVTALSALEGKSKLGNTQIFSLSNVKLKESREGESRTSTQGTFESKTRTGTVGLRLTSNIGIAASQGRTRGTMQQNSVTYRGKDVLTEIDTGKLIVTGSQISFVGKLFTRSAELSSIINIDVDMNRLAVASTNYDKTWILQSSLLEETELVGLVIEVLRGNSEKEMTVAAFKKEFTNAIDPVIADVQEKVFELQLQLSGKENL